MCVIGDYKGHLTRYENSLSYELVKIESIYSSRHNLHYFEKKLKLCTACLITKRT